MVPMKTSLRLRPSQCSSPTCHDLPSPEIHRFSDVPLPSKFSVKPVSSSPRPGGQNVTLPSKWLSATRSRKHQRVEQQILWMFEHLVKTIEKPGSHCSVEDLLKVRL